MHASLRKFVKVRAAVSVSVFVLSRPGFFLEVGMHTLFRQFFKVGMHVPLRQHCFDVGMHVSLRHMF